MMMPQYVLKYKDIHVLWFKKSCWNILDQNTCFLTLPGIVAPIYLFKGLDGNPKVPTGMLIQEFFSMNELTGMMAFVMQIFVMS